MLFSLTFSGCSDNIDVIKVAPSLVLQKKIAVGTQLFDMLSIPGTTQILVSDRFAKNIVVMQDDIIVKRLAVSVPNRTIVVTHNAWQTGQTGLFGIVADPAYPTNNYIYLFLTLRSLQDSEYANQAIVRLTYNSTTMTLNPIQETDILLEDVNRYLTKPANDGSNGGRLLFLPDGTLLASFGYQSVHASAQNMNMLGGKIIRMLTNGKPVCGNSLREIEANPFCRSDFATNPTPTAQDYIYTLGHKNNQGLALARGRVFASEHGESGGDEINALTPGGNYGFPYLCSGACLAYSGNPIGTDHPLTKEQKKSFQRNFIFP